MVIRLSRKNIVIFVLCIYIFICVFFPMDKYNIKIFSFCVICLLTIPEYIYALNRKQMAEIFVMGVCYPIILIILSYINNQDLMAAISVAYVAALILLVIPIIVLKIGKNYENILMNFLFLAELFTVTIAVMDIVGIYDVNQASAFRTFYYEMGMGYLGKSRAYSSYYRIFLKTSPLFIFSLDKFWNEHKWIKVIIAIIAIFFSGTRANLIVAFGYIVWRLLFKSFSSIHNRVFVGGSILTILLIFSKRVLNVFNSMMSTSGSISSDAIRSGQLIGLLEQLKNPHILFLGAGIGTKFFDYGRMREISGVELSYIDLLRQIGLVMFLPLMIFIFKPLVNKKINGTFKIAYLGYLAVAATNPLLFTSTAYLAYILIQIKIYHENNMDVYVNEG